MNVVIYLCGVALFVVAFALTRLSESFGSVTRIAGEAARAIRNPALDDDAKERIARQSSAQLLIQGLLIVAKAALVLVATALPFWIADVLSITPIEESFAFAARWDVLVITTVVMLLAWFAWHRRCADRS
jgi:hypothetical protein